MTRVAIQLSTLALPETSSVSRTPTRDPGLRHPDFWERYDHNTVFYDLFRTADPTVLMAVAPPFQNLIDDLQLTIRALPSGEICDWQREVRLSVERMHITVPEGTTEIVVETTEGNFPLTPQPDPSEAFRDRKVLTTLSKDNDIVWILDWARYYARVHGVDGVVIYDNGSTRYSAEELETALAKLPELAAVSVVDWPFPYGPADYRRPQTVGMGDCDYCQRGQFDHAAARVLGQAAAVVNVDIDELIFSTDGTDLFEALDQSESGFLNFPGIWVEAAHDGKCDTNRHAAYYREIVGKPPERQEAKWVLDPRRVPMEAQWMVHIISNTPIAYESYSFRFGHFRAISTNWDLHQPETGSLLRTDGPQGEPLQDIKPLRAALETAFPDRLAGFIETAPLPAPLTKVVDTINTQTCVHVQGENASEASAKMLLQKAFLQRRKGDGNATDKIIALLRQAVIADPTNVETFNQWVGALSQNGTCEEALVFLETLPRPEDPWSRARRNAIEAYALAETGNWAAARERIASALEARPHKIGYWLLKAQIDEKLGENGIAEASYMEACRVATTAEHRRALNADNGRRSFRSGLNYLTDSPVFLEALNLDQPWRNTAQFLVRIGRPGDALRYARKVVSQAPQSPWAYALLARVISASGGAESDAKQALRMMQKTAEKEIAYGPISLLSKEERNLALGTFRRALIEAKIKLGDFSGTDKLAEEILDTNDKFRSAVLTLAEAHYAEGSLTLARKLADEILKRQPSEQRAARLKMRVFRSRENIDALQKLAHRCEADKILGGEVWSTLAIVLRQNETKCEAAAALQHAIKLDPREPRYQVQLFWTYLALDQLVAAEATLTETTASFPRLPALEFMRAKLMNRQGNRAEALEAARRALEAQPGDTNAQQLFNELTRMPAE